jgi:hypothetical protein
MKNHDSILDAIIDIPVNVVVTIIDFFLELIGMPITGCDWPPSEERNEKTK